MGPIEVQRLKLRDTDEAFCSRLFGAGVTRTNPLESLLISGWVRGLSDRDIEAALAEVLGPEAALSKTAGPRSPSRPTPGCAGHAPPSTPVSTEPDYHCLDPDKYGHHNRWHVS